MSDTQGRVVYLNEYWAEFTGVDVADLLAGGLLDAIHPDDRRQALFALDGDRETDAAVVREYRLRRADGTWRFLQDTTKPVREEDGSWSGHAGVCEDVTERHEFQSLFRLQRAVSNCLAEARSRPEFLGELLRTICVDGGFHEATVCRVSGGSPTRLLAHYTTSGPETSECTCWSTNEGLRTPAFRPACSRVTAPAAGSYPIVVGGAVTGLLTLVSRKGSDVFLPLLESLKGTAAILGAMLEWAEAEERLRASQERYQALVEQSSEGIYLFDPGTHRVLDANRRFLQITGYTREHLRGLTLEGLIAHDAASISANVARVLREGEWLIGEREYLRSDGSRVPVEVSASLVRWGQESAVLVNVRDVSESRAAAVALEGLSRRLQLILDSAEEGILGLDTLGRMTFVNRSAAVLLGWSAADLEGRESHFVWHHTKKDGTPHPASECPILETIRSGKRVPVTGDVFWRRDGTRFLVEYVATPLRADGQLVGAVVLFRDVSHEARLEAVAAAVESMNSLGFVFSAVRHELGNPVNSVKMALSVMRKNVGRLDPDAICGYVDRCLLELGRVEELLSSLKTYSLYEDVRLRELGLHAFVKEFSEFVVLDFAARGVVVEVAEGGADVIVSADPRALRQVLLNLVANSAEAMEKTGGRVRLVVFSEQSWGGIRVVDDGPGMSADSLRDLFQPFYTTKTSGTGLGLVIARKMMTRMNGTIEVESEPGRGTTMVLALPSA
jgi:PAS domain S-box-containing protein